VKNVFALLIIFALGTTAWASDSTQDPIVASVAPVIGNFHAVAEGKVYRGSRPEDAGLKALAAAGVRSIVDLQGGDKLLGIALEAGESQADIDEEESAAKADHMIFYPEALSAINPDFDDQDAKVTEILKIISDPANQPVYFHCRHGSDRTGVVAALYRVFVQGCTPDQAHQEMMQYGHSQFFPWIDDYFYDRVNHDPATNLQTPGPNCPLPPISQS